MNSETGILYLYIDIYIYILELEQHQCLMPWSLQTLDRLEHRWSCYELCLRVVVRTFFCCQDYQGDDGGDDGSNSGKDRDNRLKSYRYVKRRKVLLQQICSKCVDRNTKNNDVIRDCLVQ